MPKTLREQIEDDVAGVFLDTEGGFAVKAIYTSDLDGLKEIEVIFDREVIEADPYNQGPPLRTPPMALAATADVPKGRHKATLDIDVDNDGVTTRFEIITAVPDNHGMTRLELNKV